MKNYKNILELLDQIIQFNYVKDQMENRQDGLDWNTYHLLTLKKMIEENEK